MNKEDILQGMAEIYHYSCHDCGQANLSRDEVHQVLPASKGFIVLNSGIKYICLKCWHKSNEEDK